MTFHNFLLSLYYRGGKNPFYFMKTKLKKTQVKNIIAHAFVAYVEQIQGTAYLQSNLGNYELSDSLFAHAKIILDLSWKIEKCVMANIDQIELNCESYTIEKKVECGA